MLVLHEYPIIKTTDKGVWIDIFGVKRFILNGTRKKYATPTKEMAYESFLARKERQKSLLKHQLIIVEAALNLTPNNTIAFID